MSNENAVNSAMTTVVLANICELVFQVFKNVSGNDVSNTIDGQPLNREMINGIVLAQVNNNVSKNMGGN